MLLVLASCGSDRRGGLRGPLGGGGGSGSPDGGGHGDLDAGVWIADGGGGTWDAQAPQPDVPKPPDPGEPCEDGLQVEACGGRTGGLCRPGWRWCTDGAWGECGGFEPPQAESCNGLDDDCDGDVDPRAAGCASFDDGDPDADAAQVRALSRINVLRAALGVRLVRMHAALNEAAQNHADYFMRNLPASQANAHGEESGRPGFTGEWPWDRTRAAGYRGSGIGEDMAFGAGPEGSVDMWYDSVYHRIPVVRPDTTEVGFGHGAQVEVLDVAMGGAGGGGRSVVLTPFDGQEDVPRDFYASREGPRPVLEDDQVGYPVSLVMARDDVRYVDGSITPDGGDPYALWVAHADEPHQGFLHDSIFLMSHDPMRADTWHTVRLRYRAGGGEREEVWRFRTGGR